MIPRMLPESIWLQGVKTAYGVDESNPKVARALQILRKYEAMGEITTEEHREFLLLSDELINAYETLYGKKIHGPGGGVTWRYGTFTREELIAGIDWMFSKESTKDKPKSETSINIKCMHLGAWNKGGEWLDCIAAKRQGLFSSESYLCPRCKTKARLEQGQALYEALVKHWIREHIKCSEDEVRLICEQIVGVGHRNRLQEMEWWTSNLPAERIGNKHFADHIDEIRALYPGASDRAPGQKCGATD